MNTPAEMSAEELQRARSVTKSLTDGIRKLGPRPISAEIGITKTGETAIVLELHLDG